MVHGLAADNNKLYTETMIILWNNHYNLIFIMQRKLKWNDAAILLRKLTTAKKAYTAYRIL